MTLKESFNRLRKNTFPPSINDMEWRFNELNARIQAVQRFVDSRIIQKECEQETQRLIRELFRLITPMQAQGVKKIRVGSAHDGGYVQLDDLEHVSLALSFGICDDDNWDMAMAARGIKVWQYDHTINHAPSSHPLLVFHKKMVSSESSSDAITLSELVVAHEETETPNIFLKIDIEGDEWKVFDATPESHLNRIAQIVCEFHNLSQLSESGFYNIAFRVFEKLSRSFAVTHVHANNCAPVVNLSNVIIPDVIELSFANRKRYSFCESAEIFPTELDAPCDKDNADIFLGKFMF
jgi:hypothetical protein